MCDIPIFHDDQHGTAVVTHAGLINALKLVDKKIEDVNIVSTARAPRPSRSRSSLAAGAQNIIICDSRGIIYEGREEGMNPYKEEMAKVTNRENAKAVSPKRCRAPTCSSACPWPNASRRTWSAP